MLCVIKHITSSWSKGRKVGGFVNLHTCGLKRSQTSTVKMVELLLNAEESEDIRAAIITAIIKPTNPTGSTLRTNLMKNERKRMIKLMSIIIEVYIHACILELTLPAEPFLTQQEKRTEYILSMRKPLLGDSLKARPSLDRTPRHHNY